MTAAPGTSSGAGRASPPAGLGWASTGPAGLHPSARETIERDVQAVLARDGHPHPLGGGTHPTQADEPSPRCSTQAPAGALTPGFTLTR